MLRHFVQGNLISASYHGIMSSTQVHFQKRSSRQGLRKPTRQSRQVLNPALLTVLLKFLVICALE